MTLKELFLSVDFDHVWLFIQSIAGPEMAGNAVRFKQAFDEIRFIKTEPEDEPKVIEVYRDIVIENHEQENGPEYIFVANCDDHYRRVLAGRQISVDPELNLSAEELAAHCLWEMTYYGFNDAEVTEMLEGALSDRLEEANNKYWIEYNEKRNRWRSLKFKDILNKPQKLNRSKRKRAYRHGKRLHQLRRFAKIEELQQYLVSHNIDFNLWNVLSKCKSFSLVTDHSYAFDPKDAAQYLYDLYSKYGSNINEKEDTAFTIIILTGGCKSMADFTKLHGVLKKTHKNAYILDGDCREVQITVKIISVTTYPVKSKMKN